MTISAAPTTKRMSSEDRRESIVTAAIAVFGARGYGGATTDEVAKAAGVSQPYVVRLFGTKEKLFVAALEHVVDTLIEGFRAAVPGDDEGRIDRMGRSYVNQFAVRGLHMTLQHGLLLGRDPVIGPAGRALMSRVWTFFRDEAGFDAETARNFLAQGMLINTLVGLRVIDEYGVDPGMTELLATCFPTELDEVATLFPKGQEPW